jgi:hypothetical protein
MHQVLFGLVILLMTSGCALDLAQLAPANHSVETFPSPYSSENDFLNLVNDDRAIRERARHNVFIFYKCLTKTSTNNYGREDPVLFSKSQYIAFSEIPGRIYQNRLDQLATLAKDYNKAAVQTIVDTEIGELRKIRWSEIQKEVNAIVTGARKTDLEKLSCPVTQVEYRKPEPSRVGTFLRAFFLPPTM